MSSNEGIATIDRPEMLGALAHPLRVRILELAREPRSATELASRLELPRQKVNYHVRELLRHRLLRAAGTRKKRNLVEKRYVCAARSWVLVPKLLGGAAPRRAEIADRTSSDYLLALGAELIDEVGVARREADAAGEKLPTLSVQADVRFRTVKQRRAFANALTQAVADVVAAHTSPFEMPDGDPGPGRPFRLTVACWPVPAGEDTKETES